MKFDVLIDKFWVEENLNWFNEFNSRILYKKYENSFDEKWKN